MNLINPRLEEQGYIPPKFDLNEIRANTITNPIWLHFGAGNLFRAFPAVLAQGLIEKGLTDKGIIVCEAFDEEIIEKAYAPFANQSLNVTLNSDGSSIKRVIASVAEAFGASEARERLIDIVKSPSLQIISFTITEKGYARNNSVMELTARLLYERYSSGANPVTMLSLDNCSKNGDVLKEAVLAQAKANPDITDKAGFIEYLNDKSKVSFPLSMIDKITPRPSEEVAEALKADGFKHTDIFVTSKNTYISAFVNSEAPQYLAIEDDFPNGRPELEQEGVIFCDRETVFKVEAMKVRTALNPLHTGMSIFARLFNYEYVYEAMRDEYIKRFIVRLGYKELMPTVVNPGVIDPLKFMNEVITERFPNPYIPDRPARILCDTSQKMPVRFGETLKSYAEKDASALGKLVLIPLVIAGWIRYLDGVDDNGNAFELSPDPLLDGLKGMKPEAILRRKDLFGIDLYEYELAEKVLFMLNETRCGNGSVRRTFEKYING